MSLTESSAIAVVGTDPPPLRTVLRYGVPAVGLTWAVQLTFLVAGWPITPALVIELVILVATASFLSHREQGSRGVRALFAQVLRWRFAPGWYAVVLLAFPLATMAVAAVTGHLHAAAGGWGPAVASYLIQTVLIGAVLGNVWEELFWTGALQRRLTEQVGLRRAALLTSIPFALIHLPLAFSSHGWGHTPIRVVALDWALLILVAPVFRYLLAVVWRRTGESVLAVGLLHASFNACASLAVVSGGWEYVAAAFLVAPAVVIGGRRPPVRPHPDQES